MAKKNSAMKKLVAAAAMLGVSTTMLSGATYAWFTMSREVEVQNIQMTATTPENVQLSIGALGNAGGSGDTQSKTVSLATNNGYLLTNASGAVVAPGDVSENWSNTADISNYYAFGKLIPASSINGENIFFTPDANGVGKTVDPNGLFYKAANGASAISESTVGSGSGNLNATAFTYTSSDDKNSSGTWSAYTKAVAWNNTNSDGYYIDIPVWLRTSSTQGAALTVSAYVKDVANSDASNPLAVANSGTAAGEMLYRAVRVAVLTDGGTSLPSGGLIDLIDGGSGAGNYGGPTSILNWYTRPANNGSGTKTNANTAQAVNAEGSGSVYADPVTYDGSTPIINLPAGTGTEYGAAQKYIIRVWLEGEDPDCWNDTAGQDWSINLKFLNTTTR